MKFDKINIEIIRHLRDGRKSFKVIADDLAITENTVRSRVNKLIEEGILSITGLINPAKIPGHSTVICGIKLRTTDLVAKGKELSSLKGVVSVSVVTGRYDLILYVLLNDEFSLLDFYTDEVSRVKDIQDIETFVVFKSYALDIPYLL
ncbi:MAG: Lrp/AsnC family transcriptional regulator [Spirochaetales bacterium]|nr:Lrp/AsnC family transcriptional regulator [Spirochaetales bacterium]